MILDRHLTSLTLCLVKVLRWYCSNDHKVTRGCVWNSVERSNTEFQTELLCTVRDPFTVFRERYFQRISNVWFFIKPHSNNDPFEWDLQGSLDELIKFTVNLWSHGVTVRQKVFYINTSFVLLLFLSILCIHNLIMHMLQYSHQRLK